MEGDGARRTGAAACGTERAAAGVGLAAEGALHRPLDLDFVLDAGAAAERARPCRIDPQLLTQDPDRVELLVATGVRKHARAERVQPALLRNPVTPIPRPTTAFPRPAT